MMKSVPHFFAELTAKLEDVHSVAVEGQRCDNTPDMSRVLLSHVRLGMVAMGATLHEIDQRLGETHG